MLENLPYASFATCSVKSEQTVECYYGLHSDLLYIYIAFIPTINMVQVQERSAKKSNRQNYKNIKKCYIKRCAEQNSS